MTGRRGQVTTGRRLSRAERRWWQELRRAQRPGWLRVLRAGVLLPLPLILAAALLATLLGAPVALANRAVDWFGDRYLDFPPLPEELARPAERSFVLASDGTTFATLHAEENREPVSLARIPEILQQAVLATEDRDFYRHDGIDEGALLRAFVANVRSRRIEQGGSTITQQLVKNLLLSGEQTLERKVREAVYAIDLEQRFTKDEILERYLNLTYFGNGAYGVAAAAEYYFGHPVEDVTLEEAALLAGLIRAPERNDPVDRPARARARRDVVLEQMAEAGFIGSFTTERAQARPIELDVSPTDQRFPFVAEYVKQLLLDDPRLGETRAERVDAVFGGGLRIRTTLDAALQTAAREAIAERLDDPAQDPLGSLISLDPRTGELRALGLGPETFGTCPGDTDCGRTKVNPLVPGQGGSGRQPGSAFKPFVIAAALEEDIPWWWRTSTWSGQAIPGCVDDDGPWRPRNFDGANHGVINMYEAIRRSSNVFHAKLGSKVGPADVAATAGRLGITTPVPEVCAVALGAASVFPIDMASAYGTFANLGTHCRPFLVREVTDRAGNVLLENEPECERVLDPGIAARVTDMLADNVRQGTGWRARLEDRPAAGKTGTTNDFRDAWFVGYVPELATAAWVGFEQPEPLLDILGFRRITGSTVPAQLWHAFMTEAVADLEPATFSDPRHVERPEAESRRRR